MAKVGEVFGKVVHRPSRSKNDSNLSYEYIGVLTGNVKRIAEEIILKWRNKSFRVWVSEERGDWVQEFFEDVSEKVDSEGMDVDSCEAEAEGGTTGGEGDDPEDGAEADVAGQKGNGSVSLETEGSLMQNIDPSVIVGNLKESINEEVFISGDKFDFDKVDVHEVLEVLICNVNKRKKK
ncbi:hypothetical protein HanIR_Chr06g0288751 [Helianthus annuus]|nr:hypothetical protein HanIR_Chr06g0288751 [Helianthus annuus]